MTEALALYVSGFWPWLGITIGLHVACYWLVALVVGVAKALRGAPARTAADRNGRFDA